MSVKKIQIQNHNECKKKQVQNHNECKTFKFTLKSGLILIITIIYCLIENNYKWLNINSI